MSSRSTRGIPAACILGFVLLPASAATASVMMDWGTAYDGKVTIYNVPGGESRVINGPWASNTAAYTNLEINDDPGNVSLYAKMASNNNNDYTNQFYYFGNQVDNIGHVRFESYGNFNTDVESMSFNISNSVSVNPNPPEAFQVRLKIGDETVYNSGLIASTDPPQLFLYSETFGNVAGKTFEIIVEANGFSTVEQDANLNVFFSFTRLGAEPVPGLTGLAPLAGLALARRRRR